MRALVCGPSPGRSAACLLATSVALPTCRSVGACEGARGSTPSEPADPGADSAQLSGARGAARRRSADGLARRADRSAGCARPRLARPAITVAAGAVGTSLPRRDPRSRGRLRSHRGPNGVTQANRPSAASANPSAPGLSRFRQRRGTSPGLRCVVGDRHAHRPPQRRGQGSLTWAPALDTGTVAGDGHGRGYGHGGRHRQRWRPTIALVINDQVPRRSGSRPSQLTFNSPA